MCPTTVLRSLTLLVYCVARLPRLFSLFPLLLKNFSNICSSCPVNPVRAQRQMHLNEVSVNSITPGNQVTTDDLNPPFTPPLHGKAGYMKAHWHITEELCVA